MTTGQEIVASVILAACIIAGMWERGPAKKKSKGREFLEGQFAPMMVVLNIIAAALTFTGAWAWAFLWLNIGGLVLGGYYYSLKTGGGSH